MTTSSRPSSNKTALRASLKKEDDSLADRLVGTDAPTGATNQADTTDLDLPTSAAATASATPSAPARPPAAKRPVTARKKPVQASAVEPAAAPEAQPAGGRKGAATGAEP